MEWNTGRMKDSIEHDRIMIEALLLSLVSTDDLAEGKLPKGTTDLINRMY